MEQGSQGGKKLWLKRRRPQAGSIRTNKASTSQEIRRMQITDRGPIIPMEAEAIYK